MKTYSIVVEKKAELDLYDTVIYIQRTLHEPEIAASVYTDIKQQIETLAKIPERYAVIDIEPFRSLGIRKFSVGKQLVFYRIDESTSNVHIIRILHSRREWKDLL